jgi:two-component system CheB/CheR fusion protein
MTASTPAGAVAGRRQDVLVKMSVRPVRHDAWPGEMLLVVFDETPAAGAAPAAPATRDAAIAALETELQQRNQQLAATIEQYETSSEELKASNEELQAINEELRSATEELETSKEELQSTNEELITVNHELKTKIDETTEINDDLNNLISSSGTATVFVDAAIRIKRFTPAAAALFNLIAGDIGRSLFDITPVSGFTAGARMRGRCSRPKDDRREIRSTDGRHLLARLLPIAPPRPDRRRGARNCHCSLRWPRTASVRAAAMALIAESMTDFAILTIDMQGRIATWTRCRHVFGYDAEAIGQAFDILFTGRTGRAAHRPTPERANRPERARAGRRWMRRGRQRLLRQRRIVRAAARARLRQDLRDRTDMATSQGSMRGGWTRRRPASTRRSRSAS